MATNSLSQAQPSSTSHNYSQSILNEIKKFYKHVNQLNILLKETNNACKELKILQQSSQSLSEDIENLQINDLDEMFIKSLQKKRICFVVLGQNVLAQSILVNELLARYIMPFEITNRVNDENWRFVRIKHGKIGGYTYQLVDSEFEVMSSEQLNKKFTFPSQFQTASSTSRQSSFSTTSRTSNSGKTNSSSPKQQQQSLSHQASSSLSSITNSSTSMSTTTFTIPLDALRLDESLRQARSQLNAATNEAELDEARVRLAQVEAVAENHAVLEVTLDLKLLENNVEVLVHSAAMNEAIMESLLADVIPVYLYGIIESRLSEHVRLIIVFISSTDLLFIIQCVLDL